MNSESIIIDKFHHLQNAKKKNRKRLKIQEKKWQDGQNDGMVGLVHLIVSINSSYGINMIKPIRLSSHRKVLSN